MHKFPTTKITRGKEEVRVLFVLKRAHIGGIKAETVSSVTANRGKNPPKSGIWLQIGAKNPQKNGIGLEQCKHPFVLSRICRLTFWLILSCFFTQSYMKYPVLIVWLACKQKLIGLGQNFRWEFLAKTKLVRTVKILLGLHNKITTSCKGAYSIINFG